MPLPIPFTPPSTPPSTAQPYYLRDPQTWAVAQERQRHNQALYLVGEWAIFFLMWHVLDFEYGLVARCVTCYASADPLANRITNVYQQPTRNKCPDCYGTTFEGGYRARIVRPAVFTDSEESERTDKRGAVHPDDVTVESTSDFRVRSGDYVLRADNSRWRLRGPQRVMLRTGFEHPTQAGNSLTYNSMRAGFEEPTTVAYLLPPTDAPTVRATLSAPVQFPGSFAGFEVIRAPLIPPSIRD